MVVDRAFAVAGAGRRVAIEVTDNTSAANFVREGLGVSMLPAFAVRDGTGLILKRVSDAELEWPLGVAVSALRQPSAAARALLALIGESAA
jgi:DNA-binding transcriptional LysR family regulator